MKAGAAALFLVGGGVALVFTGALDSLVGGGQKRATVELPGSPLVVASVWMAPPPRFASI